MGADLPPMTKAELIEACNTFPDDAGLGWDRLHPKVINRLSDDLVDLLLTILTRCEKKGEWPRAVAMVLIALLRKPEGDFRAIGLCPGLPRMWMRTRRKQATKWESKNSKWFVFAGKGKGADVAAWLQGASAELAATARTEAEYAQVLLDLVKAFDNIPHWLLIREARELGTP